jgi:hypothetical protein
MKDAIVSGEVSLLGLMRDEFSHRIRAAGEESPLVLNKNHEEMKRLEVLYVYI